MKKMMVMVIVMVVMVMRVMDDDLSQGGCNDVLFMCVLYKGYDISEQDDDLLQALGYLDNITLCNFITFKA